MNRERYPVAYYEKLIRERTPFLFTRWGDGEVIGLLWGNNPAWLKQYGHRRNANDEAYTPELCRGLRQALKQEGDHVYHGLLGIGARLYEKPLTHFLGQEGHRWVDGDVMLKELKNGRLGSFLAALRGRDVVYVGPSYLEGVAQATFPDLQGFIPVPPSSAYEEAERLVGAIHQKTRVSGADVVLMSAGMGANIIASRLRRDLTVIDFGSMLDAFTGRQNRSYMRQVNWEQLALVYGIKHEWAE